MDKNKVNTVYYSANALYPVIEKHVGRVNSVIDIGCGNGAWLSVFNQHGAKKILGVDKDFPSELFIPIEDFLVIDITCGLDINSRFDLVLCLEVAEHIPEYLADVFISQLCKLGEKVLFSASIPLQGGSEHVNEQFLSYWISKFRINGYAFVDFRYELFQYDIPCWWYQQNMLLFTKGGKHSNIVFNIVYSGLEQRYCDLIKKSKNEDKCSV